MPGGILRVSVGSLRVAEGGLRVAGGGLRVDGGGLRVVGRHVRLIGIICYVVDGTWLVLLEAERSKRRSKELL